MIVQLRFFASLREDLGQSQESWETHAGDLAGLRLELMARGAVYEEALALHRPVRMALNQVMVQDNAVLTEGCEVGFFPPVTGG
ncbi:MAG: Molybdopterin synthase sulfur carrier subunit [Pseudomonadota bacterium]|jgi:molybdopterin synthase sulfur carrier subunit